MKFILTIFFFISFVFSLIAQQDLSKLTYKEIDSMSYTPKIKGEYGKAIVFMQAGREKAKAEFGTQDTLYATYTNDLGLFYQMTGQYQISEKMLLEAQHIFLKVFGKWHMKYARNLNYLAQLYLAMGKLEQAEPIVLEAKMIEEKLVGRYNIEYATLLNNLAALYKEMGNLAQAEHLHIETKIIRAKVLGKEHPHYAMTLNNLAMMYKTMGRYEEAEPLYLEANEIKEKNFGKKHYQYAQGLNNLALLYYDMKKYDLVEPLLLECKTIQEKVMGKEHITYALTLNNLAGMYQEMKLYEKSEQLFLEAKAIREKTLGKGHPNYTSILNSLGVLYSDMGKMDLAWDYLKQTLESASGLNISLHITEAWKDSLIQVNYSSYQHLDKIVRALRTVYNLLGIDSLNPHKEQQVIVAELVNQLLKKSRDGIVNEQDKLRVLSQSYLWMLNGLKVMDLEKQAEKAFEMIELNKATLLLDATKAEQNYQLGGLPDSLIEEEKRLLKKQAELEASLLENHPEEEKTKLLSVLNVVAQELSTFKKKVEKQYPKYASLKYKTIEVTIKDIQKELKPKAALVEYVIGNDLVYILYIDKNQHKIIQQPIQTKELNTRIEQLQDVLSNYALLNKKEEQSYRIYTEQAFWFYQNLIKPALIPQSDVNQLIIVSDGELGHLPFETFLVEQAPQTVSGYNNLHYLMKDFKISYSYSATLFVEAQKTSSKINNGKILAMASNYLIKLDSTKKDWRLPTHKRIRDLLKPLPAAKKEVEILSKELNGIFGFDKEASEKVFKEKAGDFAVIHLAMHGLLDNNAPILSGLAFTEDGDSIENNFLQAYEISKMELNADLVVLSACETGFGRFDKGNGIASLAQAFAYAGASALIVSLWQVNDYATAEIMKNLYHNLADGMEKDEALRQAKLQYMKKATGITAHPAFWSPFIMMGNTEPVYLKKKGDWYWWLVGGGVLVLAGVFFAIRKRK